MQKLVSLVLGTALFAGAGALAEDQSAPTTVTTRVSDVNQITQSKNWGAVLQLSTSSNFKDPNSSDISSDTVLMIRPQRKLNDNYSIAARTDIIHTNIGPQDTVMGNTQVLFIRNPFAIAEYTRLKLSAQGVLPTDERLRKDDTFQGALGFIAGVDRELRLFHRDLIVEYSFNAIKNFHRFESNAENKDNLSYRLRNLVSAEFFIAKQFSVSTTAYYQAGRTYQNSLKTAFLLGEDLNYYANEHLTFTLSHSNEGSALAANGMDSNVQFYDQANSIFEAGLTYIY